MQITNKKLPQGKVELIIEIPYENLAPYLEKALFRMTKETKLDGFRPGKVPEEIIKERVGDAGILAEASNDIVNDTYIKVLEKEKVNPIAMADIEILKVAPNNPFSYKAIVPVLPEVKLGDLDKIKIKLDKVDVGDEKVNKALDYLAKSRAKQKRVLRKLQKGDIANIDMDILENNVSVEGGQAKGHLVKTAEDHYIPGFNEQLFGLSEGEEKNFALPFPKDHYNKRMAGKLMDFKVKMTGVFELETPQINDEFAKEIGNFKSLQELKDQLKKNITEEEQGKINQKQEIEMLEKIVKNSEIGEIPEVMLREETKKMIYEFSNNLAKQGMKFEDYLSHIKKTQEDLKQEFLPQAEKRVKVALVVNKYAQENKVFVTPEEVSREINHLLGHHKDDAKNAEYIKSDEYKSNLENILNNQKVIRELRKKIIS